MLAGACLSQEEAPEKETQRTGTDRGRQVDQTDRPRHADRHRQADRHTQETQPDSKAFRQTAQANRQAKRQGSTKWRTR